MLIYIYIYIYIYRSPTRIAYLKLSSKSLLSLWYEKSTLKVYASLFFVFFSYTSFNLYYYVHMHIPIKLIHVHITNIYIYIYIYIVIHRQTFSLYHSSSVWLDPRYTSSRHRNPADFTSVGYLTQEKSPILA